ncbi:dihydroorotate dehydrogenase electron transfer subunit [Candidatus Woesearchaeota archaeon]|jgi:dihydroorotate dehydrogenase electron transfer subunit|nr:dihydroorotate dehydrogenase electron transfer subunit [Candidatus Woesearchaeota archaeon]MDP6648428.1 dihydroorotate dehydrogenase electron transfer subunit [Candidatus Woesearchaeota archaeon]|tara:strand:- start:29928 stop:30740 length:813 start_codon:yes stop_codon:yes gene_type:complete
MQQTELCKTEIPRIMEVSKVVDEGKNQKSFFFKGNIMSKPGQFIMVWIPGLDEKPMAVSYHNKNEFAFTSQAIGKFTNALENIKKGNKLGIRGPYGSSFPLKNNACVVAGGVGLSSVSTLIDALHNPLIIYGARTKDHLIYLKRFKNKNLKITTDDGSFGRKGYNTAILDEVLSKNKKIKVVYTCGPEIMMKKVLDICNKHKVECQASVERFMACGFGICGKCMVNDRIVCIDGPIFNSKQLSKMSEFGNFARLKSGRKVTIQEYHGNHT